MKDTFREGFASLLDGLKCDEVTAVVIDFDNCVGKLYMRPGHSCDMAGCCALFRAFDPDVSQILTYSGDTPLNRYCVADDGEWCDCEPGGQTK